MASKIHPRKERGEGGEGRERGWEGKGREREKERNGEEERERGRRGGEREREREGRARGRGRENLAFGLLLTGSPLLSQVLGSPEQTALDLHVTTKRLRIHPCSKDNPQSEHLLPCH